MRIALTADKRTWTLSVPGNAPGMKILPGEAAGDVTWENRCSESGMNRAYFKHDGSTRAWTTLDAEGVKGLRKGTSLEVKRFDRQDPTPTSKSRRYVWPSNDSAKAVAKLPECINAN